MSGYDLKVAYKRGFDADSRHPHMSGLRACAKVVYLCGGINGLTDAQAGDWREDAKTLLLARTLDPMRRDYRGREDENVGEIVRGDLEDIYASTHLIVNAVRASWGTAMEVWEAQRCGKKIHVITPEGIPISPWLRYCATAIHGTLEDAAQAINQDAE